MFGISLIFPQIYFTPWGMKIKSFFKIDWFEIEGDQVLQNNRELGGTLCKISINQSYQVKLQKRIRSYRL